MNMSVGFKKLKKIIRLLASLKLAVFILISLAILTAVGTIVEAKYDSYAATQWVYHTPWMYVVLSLLAVNLTAVMIDRLPWQRRHLSFILAHIGILLLLSGAWITMEKGLDGSMRVANGQSNRFVQVSDTELTVWSSFDGDRYTKLLEREVNFFKKSPKDNPVSLQTDSGEIKVVDYKPYMLGSQKIRSVESNQVGSALRFQIQNARVNVVEWLFQNKPNEIAQHNFGPAQIYFGELPKQGLGGNEIFIAKTKNPEKFDYVIYFKGQKSKSGVINLNEELETGWMGLKFKVLQFIAKAERIWDFQEMQAPTPLTNSAIKLTFQGKEHWLQLDDVLKIFTDKAVYIITYGHKRIDIGFDLFLKKFEVGRYPGTMRAASYQSLVQYQDDLGKSQEQIISMNEPLKYKGLTLYQASFQDGPDGQPVASVFSVNYDPGRWIKYLGSLIISLGVVILFYDRRKSARSQLAPKADQYKE